MAQRNGRLDGRREFAWAMHRVGFDVSTIAAFFGVSMHTVWRYIRQHEWRAAKEEK